MGYAAISAFKALEKDSAGLAGIVGTLIAGAIVWAVVRFREALARGAKALRQSLIKALGATERPPEAEILGPNPTADTAHKPQVVLLQMPPAQEPPVAIGSTPKPSNLPGSIGPLFKGREEFLARLHKSFDKHDPTAITAKAVHGLGGLGKTRAAIEYAHAHADEYGATFFLTGKSASDLHGALADLAGPAVLGLPEKDIPDRDAQAEAVIGWLRAHPGWLMIIDNVDDTGAAAAVGVVLDRVGGEGNVLITSRIGDWGHRVEAIDLDLLSVEAAKELLRASTPRRTKADDEDAALTRLADKQLGCLSLALVQAAAFIDEKHISFADYSERFETESKALLAKLGESAVRNLGYEFSVAVTWHATFDQLSDAGRLLLDMLAWLSIEPIPRSLFDVWPYSNVDLEEGLAELTRYSLVHWEEGNSAITLHRLVTQVTRDNLDAVGRDRALETLFPWIFAVNPDLNAGDVRCWPQLLPLLPHALALFERTNEYGRYPGQTNVYNDYATLLQSLTRYAQAEPLYRRSLAIDEASLGPDHSAVATALNNLADFLRSTGRLDEAEPLFRRALAIDEANFGPDHLKVSIRLNNLALLLAATNRVDEAEQLSRRALAITEASLGPDQPELAIRLNNLAGLLQDTGRLAEAEPLFRRALAIDEAAFGPDHPYVAIRLNNLAALLNATERLAEAEPLSRRAVLVVLRSSYSNGHVLSETAVLLRNYADALAAAGKSQEEIGKVIRSMMSEVGFDPSNLWPTIFGDEA